MELQPGLVYIAEGEHTATALRRVLNSLLEP
jgi:hypothetical protein